MKKTIHLLGVIALAITMLTLFIAPAQAATGAVVDTFETGSFLGIFGAPAGFQSVSATDDVAGVLGGERDIVLTRNSANTGAVDLDFGLSFPGTVSYASGSSVTGSLLLAYDGDDNDASNLNPIGLGGLDLTSGGGYAFALGAVSDLGASATLTVYSNSTSCSSASIAIPADPSYTFAIFQVDFTSFSTASGCTSPANFANVGAITLLIDGSTPAVDISVDLFETVANPPPTNPGTGTPGYWKNHPEAWPVDVITIGGRMYTKEEAIAYINGGDKDKTYTLFRALVSAKLNVLIGNDSSCVADVIAAADDWMAVYPVGSDVRAGKPNSPWRVGEPLYITLDKYNNGLLCAPHRN